MTYIILLLAYILIGIFVFKIYEKDILSPTIITVIGFSGAFICSIIGLISWNYNKDINIYSILIFILGITAFSIGEYIARQLYKKYVKEKKENKNFEITRISKPILIIILIFLILTSILLILEIKRICEKYGFYSNSISHILSYYRTKTGLFSSDGFNKNMQVNFVVKQMQKICNAFNIIIYTYICSKMLKIKKYKNEKIDKSELAISIIILLISLLQTFLFNGGRSIAFHFIVSYIGIYFFYYIYIYKFKLQKRSWIKIIGVLAVIIVLYYLMLPFVGRKTKYNSIIYTTFSLGVSVPSLDLYIKEDNSKSNQIGEETFSGLFYTLNKFKIIKYDKPLTHEWYSFGDNGTLSSNTFTSLRSYYKDYGYFGLIILQFIFGFIITLAYLKSKNSKNMLGYIIYFNYFYILIEQIRDEQFYSLINVSTIANVVITIAIYHILIKIQEKRGLLQSGV